MITDEILEGLNENQRAAVLYNEGASLIVAGAGSGKTRVLTRKIAYLMAQGMSPWQIMALTFTNKAAREMKERIATLVGGQAASQLWMGTFHSVFLRILRTESDAIGFSRDFTIYDANDTKNLIKTLVKEMELDEKVYKPGAVYSAISRAKNDMISAQEYPTVTDYMERDRHARMPLIASLYERYSKRCKQSNAMDFDDILYYTNRLFRSRPDLLQKWQERFRFILVDEYQDTNYSQYLIVKQLAQQHQHVCVVGDDSQSIYAFRGANIDNILNFQQSYSSCRLFKLEQNYRSTQTIVKLANSLIEKNKRQIKKHVYSERDQGQPVRLLQAHSDLEESYLIAGHLQDLRQQNRDNWNQFAVLYRTNAQSRLLEEAFRKRGIPYRVYGGLSFYQQKEVKDFIAFLRLLCNVSDEEAFKRSLTLFTPTEGSGLGKTTLAKIQDAALAHEKTLWQILCDPLAFGLTINSGTMKKLTLFRMVIESHQALLNQMNVYELSLRLFEASGLKYSLLKDKSPEGQSARENIDSLLSGMNDYCRLKLEEGGTAIYVPDYLSEVSLLTDMDEEDSGQRVTLMTIHASKGLEFNNIVVAGLEEDLLPSKLSSNDNEVEEERRLFYVAITRAGNNCTLTYAKQRFRNGTTEFTRPSRFLRDLDQTLIRSAQTMRSAADPVRPNSNPVFGLSPRSSVRPTPTPSYSSSSVASTGNRKLSRINTSASSSIQSSARSDSSVPYRSGQRVLHERFGEGVVLSVDGQGDNCKIKVDFTHFGQKLLLLRFASMKAID